MSVLSRVCREDKKLLTSCDALSCGIPASVANSPSALYRTQQVNQLQIDTSGKQHMSTDHCLGLLRTLTHSLADVHVTLTHFTVSRKPLNDPLRSSVLAP